MHTAGAMRSSLPAPLERRPHLPLIALVAAIWPVWSWLAMRAAHDAGDAWALLSLATAVALLWRDRLEVRPAHVRWGAPTLLLLIYAASYPFALPLVRALIAMSALAAACSELFLGRRMDLRLWGLLLLALPLVPSLNFYLGYPLRVLVGEATSFLLQMNGFAAVRDGATLLWNGKQVSIDAPCSGIKMLWTGMYLSCALAALLRLDARRTVMLGAISLALVMMANILRATALFFVEAGIAPEAQPAHALIGVVVFVGAAVAIAGMAVRLRPAAHAS